ncbi:hypothetical protein BS47DRAFT_1364718 [Hydnum rufescens UP504]|uniref:Uncharacterized protein n=1 Tax=Hydnum rufescens UP504 TaxID=1448309 RepID=A0A9P6AQS7_9AGAM|nr:hypothetical protein BS47DRAFT_1364718 [Hydnum rufescens UP504]
MRGKNGIPNDAYVPLEIEPDGLLKMDVNQPVWQDANIADFPMGMFLILADELWKADTVALPGADGGPEWDVMPQLPLLQKARSRTKTEDLFHDDWRGTGGGTVRVDAVVLNALDHVDSWFHAA